MVGNGEAHIAGLAPPRVTLRHPPKQAGRGGEKEQKPGLSTPPTDGPMENGNQTRSLTSPGPHLSRAEEGAISTLLVWAFNKHTIDEKDIHPKPSVIAD